MDTVFLHGIRAELIIGLDAWHRPNKAQPVILNIDLVPVDGLESAANEDNVSLTLDYGKLYKSLTQSLSSQPYDSLHHLLAFIHECLPPVRSSSIEVVLPKAALLADDGIVVSRKALLAEDIGPAVLQRLEWRKIQCKCIIGVNPHERLERQRIVLTVSSEGVSTPIGAATLAGVSIGPLTTPTYVDAVKEIVERVEQSSYQTVEALATAVAQVVTMNYGFDNATVRIEKPNAIAPIDAAGVQLTRSRAFFENKDFWKVKRT